MLTANHSETANIYFDASLLFIKYLVIISINYAPTNIKYSVSHLIQTPGDHGNLFLLKGVLIKVIQNRGHFHTKSH